MGASWARPSPSHRVDPDDDTSRREIERKRSKRPRILRILVAAGAATAVVALLPGGDEEIALPPPDLRLPVQSGELPDESQSTARRRLTYLRSGRRGRPRRSQSSRRRTGSRPKQQHRNQRHPSNSQTNGPRFGGWEPPSTAPAAPRRPTAGSEFTPFAVGQSR